MTGIVRFLMAVFLGGVFVFAGAMKIFDPVLFAQDIGNFRLLPHEMIHFVAITLPWVEWVAGAMLLCGVWVRANATLIGIMLLIFIIAVVSAVARNLNIECGCFGNADAGPIGWKKIGENTLMLIMAGWLAWKARN